MKRIGVHVNREPSDRPTKRFTVEKKDEKKEEAQEQPIPFYFSVTWPASKTKPALTRYYKWRPGSFCMSVMVPYLLRFGKRDELHVDLVHALLSLETTKTREVFISVPRTLTTFRQALARAIMLHEKSCQATTHVSPLNAIHKEVVAENLGRVHRVTNPTLIQSLPFTQCFTVWDEEEDSVTDSSDFDSCHSDEPISSDTTTIDSNDEELSESTTSTTSTSSTEEDETTDDDDGIPYTDDSSNDISSDSSNDDTDSGEEEEEEDTIVYNSLDIEKVAKVVNQMRNIATLIERHFNL